MTEQSWVVGIRISPDREEPTFFCIVFGENLTPVLKDGSLVLCGDLRQIGRVAQFSSGKVVLESSACADFEDACDIALALYLIENEDFDMDSSIVNCINTLTDLVSATRGVLPPHLKHPLYQLADHMTFNKDIASFFRDSGVTREQSLEGIVWCTGWILTHAFFLKSELDDEGVAEAEFRNV